MRRDTFRFKLIGVILITVAIILTLWLLLRGQTNVAGEHPEPDVSKSLVCINDDFEYFAFSATDAIKTDTHIIAVFVGDELSSISLTQKYFYNSSSEAMAEKSRFQVSVEKSFSGSSLGYRALGANYAAIDNMLRMSLSANSDEINMNSKKYFLIEDSPNTIFEYKKNYEKQNFTCKENI